MPNCQVSQSKRFINFMWIYCSYCLQSHITGQEAGGLGANAAEMSYKVGFDSRYPRHVLHRGASSPSIHDHPSHIPCGEEFQHLRTDTSDPNVIVGAVDGGPDNGDRFSDSREVVEQTEPTTYVNAPWWAPWLSLQGTSTNQKQRRIFSHVFFCGILVVY